MHPDPVFHPDDRRACEALIADVGFGMVFAAAPDGPRVAHTPLLSDGAGTVMFHLSKGNALTRPIEIGADVLIVINGPDGYVSPRWYANRDTVPTWNYVALELSGPVTRMEDAALEAFLHAAIARHEGRLGGEPWRAEEASERIWNGLFRGITGFTMAVETWRPTFKLSQNKPVGDRTQIADGLEVSGHAALAAKVRGHGA